MPLVSYRDVCPSKDEGDLGFRDMKSWNSALLAKSLWNIHQKKNTIWIRWVNQFYLKWANIWDVSPSKDDSPLFTKLLEIKDALVQPTVSFQADAQGQPIVSAQADQGD